MGCARGKQKMVDGGEVNRICRPTLIVTLVIFLAGPSSAPPSLRHFERQQDYKKLGRAQANAFCSWESTLDS